MGLITNVDYASLWDGMKSYAVKVGRVAARPVAKSKKSQKHRIKLLKNTDCILLIELFCVFLQLFIND